MENGTLPLPNARKGNTSRDLISGTCGSVKVSQRFETRDFLFLPRVVIIILQPSRAQSDIASVNLGEIPKAVLWLA